MEAATLLPTAALRSDASASTLWQRAAAGLRRDRTLAAAAGFLAILLLLAIFAAPHTGYGYEQLSDATLAPPSAQHWFGTDAHGRDLLTRILYGARLSLAVAAAAAGISLTIGVAYGMIAGYLGGRVDNAMMRAVDVLYCLPRLVFVIVLIAAAEKPAAQLLTAIGMEAWAPQARLVLLFVGLGCVEWLTMARLVRGQVLVLKEQAFVQAARALGQSPIKILTRHLWPNVAGVVLVCLTLMIPVVILEESFLSFLGLGVQPPAASWGSLLADGAQGINPLRAPWWLVVFPGLVMVVTLLAFNFLGDGLRDALDPKSRGR